MTICDNCDKYLILLGITNRGNMEEVTEYKPEFDKIAFDTLSEKALRSPIHVCEKIGCSLETLGLWRTTNPGFDKSIKLGLIHGERKFRDLMARFSVRNSNKVNTKLLLTLGSNVYGIKEEPEIINIINNVTADPETLLKEKGIPIPNIDIPDLED